MLAVLVVDEEDKDLVMDLFELDFVKVGERWAMSVTHDIVDMECVYTV